VKGDYGTCLEGALRKFWLAREQMKASVFGQQLRKLKNRLD
jgi:hypothetical protein